MGQCKYTIIIIVVVLILVGCSTGHSHIVPYPEEREYDTMCKQVDLINLRFVCFRFLTLLDACALDPNTCEQHLVRINAIGTSVEFTLLAVE